MVKCMKSTDECVTIKHSVANLPITDNTFMVNIVQVRLTSIGGITYSGKLVIFRCPTGVYQIKYDLG